jgi:hypothetical protein
LHCAAATCGRSAAACGEGREGEGEGAAAAGSVPWLALSFGDLNCAAQKSIVK